MKILLPLLFFALTAQAYGNQAQLTFAGSGYDMAVLIAETLSDGNSELLRALQRVSSRSGVLGPFSFVRTPQAGAFFQYPVGVKQIRGAIGEPLTK